ncbi:MAG: NAD(P)-dependent oxidoreductase [Anaerolineaceae bacterium]|nr:NAD(P)-dependent oxidoreductase [Anaerolineaceae bacterium]
MKKIVITGATGAIGTAIIKNLAENNIEVLVLCHPGSGRIKNILQNDFVNIRYCDLSELSSFSYNDNDFDVFYHLAWDGTNGPSRDDMYLQNQNVKYALDAVALAKKLGCKRFIGVGSQAEYGRVEGKLRPDTPVNPTMGYGIAKLTAGLMTRQYAHQLGLEHIWVRVLSVYGPNDGPNSLVRSTIRKLQNGETPKLTKCDQLWDYLYSGDAARAFRLLGEKGCDGKTYVLGSGQVRPLRKYVEKIRDLISPGAKLDFGAIPYYPHQVMHLEADIRELTADTGFIPQTSFDRGIQKLL